MKQFSDIETFTDEVLEVANYLYRKIPGMKLADRMDYAIRIQENQIRWEFNKRFELAHCLQDLTPSALEAIAIQLGYKGKTMTAGDIITALDNIADNLQK